MKIWTCGTSPRSGSPNAWTRIKNVNGASRLSKFGIFSGPSKWFPVGRDWWPWTKPGYITMTRRQSNNQWSGGIASHPPPKKFRMQKSAGKVLASIFWDQDGILLIDYFPKGQTINAEFYSSLLVQWKDILKESVAEVHQGVLFWHDNAPAHRGLATQKKLAYLGFQCLDHPPYSPDLTPLDYHLFPGLKKIIEIPPFFVRRGGNCCRGDLVRRTTFWIFFFWVACKS